MVLKIIKKIRRRKTRSVIDDMLNEGSTLFLLRKSMVDYFAGASSTSRKSILEASSP